MADGEESRMAIDAKILSAGMMYRSRRRRNTRHKRQEVIASGPESGAEPDLNGMPGPTTSTAAAPVSMRQSGSFEGDSEEDLVEYVTRDLQPPEVPALVSQRAGAAMTLGSPQLLCSPKGSTLEERRQTLQRRSSVEGETQLKEVIFKMEELGDRIDGRLQLYISAALKELEIEYGEGVSYSGYKGVVAKLFQEFSTSWQTVAAVYRMSDEILDDVAEEAGVDDVNLQAQLQDYNSRAIVEVAGDFWKRVGGMTGILSATEEDLRGPETEL